MTSKEALSSLKEEYYIENNERIITFHSDDDRLKIIERDLTVLECFKKYFHFELIFENNQTYLVFKSKERYLPVDDKLSVANKYYEPLKEWLENDK